MTPNIVFKKIKVALTLRDEDVADIFALGGLAATRSQLEGWRCGETHKNFRAMKPDEQETFLDGLIAYMRDRPTKPGAAP
jgi:uncharacterized protein YehS (DUF1456 family)